MSAKQMFAIQNVRAARAEQEHIPVFEDTRIPDGEIGQKLGYLTDVEAIEDTWVLVSYVDLRHYDDTEIKVLPQDLHVFKKHFGYVVVVSS